MDAIESKTRALLKSIVEAPEHTFYLSAKAVSAAVVAGMVIQNPTLVDDKKNVATKLTTFGLNYLNSPEGTDPATIEGDKTSPADIPEGDGEDGAKAAVSTVTGRNGKTFARVRIKLPAASNTRQSSYPLDALLPPDEEGNLDGIFLGPTDEIKDPSKAYPAVASAANKRFKGERKFTSRVMDGAPFGHPGVMGVGIFRTE